ncbi:MAG: sulfite exporter TauE/SafE family protein [Patescibacteria group bacterium]|jgi:sulfite exporter TauE/SafE/copper chaperone CopZ|nr:sulfite exporter TauE/SafE family protein [Patescibacteria group bacterium]
MIKNLSILLQNKKKQEDKYQVEAEIEILTGVRKVNVDFETNKCEVEFNEEEISEKKILDKINKLGLDYKLHENRESAKIKKHVYFVEGMHCASCEITTEKSLIKRDEVKSVDASVGKGQVEIRYSGDYPKIEELNKLFKGDDYIFSDNPKKKHEEKLITTARGELIINKQKFHDLLIIVAVSIALIIGFSFINKTGISALISVNSTSALPMFLVFGLLAGLSSCAALVGGVILSMSKQWSSLYAKDDKSIKKLQPHLIFNSGRLVSYALFGGILGAIGSFFKLSLTANTILIALVSLMMLFLALQMLGVKYFQKFQISAPKFITRYAVNEDNFKGRYMPFVMGALTFFLPCGFTITAQTLALASGSMIQGMLIMLFFALGTLPIMLFIGISSVKFSKKPHLANRFLKVAGVLVLFFALFNINAQLNVLGWTSLSDVTINKSQAIEFKDDGLPEVVNGIQVLKMDAKSTGYTPNRLKVRAGIPVRWEITDKGTSGCTNAVMSRGLFDGQIALTPGKTSVKEFTPEQPGIYKFSCWMGMVSGTIEVVDEKAGSAQSGTLSALAVSETEVIPSGATGCGCGGGESDSCGQ